MCYQRKLNDEVYIAALNFSSRKKKLPKEINLRGALIISCAGQTELGGFLLPWEGVLTRAATS
jgi:hypothetical protein